MPGIVARGFSSAHSRVDRAHPEPSTSVKWVGRNPHEVRDPLLAHPVDLRELEEAPAVDLDRARLLDVREVEVAEHLFLRGLAPAEELPDEVVRAREDLVEGGLDHELRL